MSHHHRYTGRREIGQRSHRTIRAAPRNSLKPSQPEISHLARFESGTAWSPSVRIEYLADFRYKGRFGRFEQEARPVGFVNKLRDPSRAGGDERQTESERFIDHTR